MNDCAITRWPPQKVAWETCGCVTSHIGHFNQHATLNENFNVVSSCFQHMCPYPSLTMCIIKRKNKVTKFTSNTFKILEVLIRAPKLLRLNAHVPHFEWVELFMWFLLNCSRFSICQIATNNHCRLLYLGANETSWWTISQPQNLISRNYLKGLCVTKPSEQTSWKLSPPITAWIILPACLHDSSESWRCDQGPWKICVF